MANSHHVNEIRPAPSGPPEAARLRCQHLADPLAVGTAHPVFSWVPTGPGGDQTAYQLLVAGDPGSLNPGGADLWNSGRVAGDRVNGVAYEGRPLTGGRRYWWTVRLWGADGAPGPWAPPATFETGLLGREEWHATWIAAEAGISSPLLRTEFEVPGRVRRARAYVAALGYYEMRLNGRRVGDRVLDPAPTDYDHDPGLVDGEGEAARITGPRVLYSTYDITDLVVGGADGAAAVNAVGLVLGHGWYSAEDDLGPRPFPRTPLGDRPAALLQIEIETDDDRRLTVVSDGGWRTAPGPVLYNDYANGERHDARRELPGWDRPGFAGGPEWRPAIARPAPAGALRAQLVEPIRVVETRAARRTVSERDGRRVVDFGQHVSGWTRIRVSGPAGAEVTVRHAGDVDAAGALDPSANLAPWMPARQTDVYVLGGSPAGAGEHEVWEPRFTLHGFRYAEVGVSDPEVTVHEIEARVVHSDVEMPGEFRCSDAMLERIHANVVWSLRASLQGFPQDAADRAERVGWLGDPGWTIEDYLYGFDSLGFWLKWLDDLAGAQLPDGRFPIICPIMWRGRLADSIPEGALGEMDEEGADFTKIFWPYMDKPDFTMTTYTSIAWNLYRFYGDRSILETHYERMRHGLDFLRSRADDFIVEEGWGDHMEPQPDGTCSVDPKRTPIALTSTAWFHAVATMVADAAEAIGRHVDAIRYRELAESIRTAYNERFLDPASGRYASGSQTAQALSLWLGLVPAEHRDRVVRALIEEIKDRDGGRLSTGTMGTAALQHVLSDVGAADVMYEIATQPAFPGWAYQVVNGATTLWETWGGDEHFSRNMKLLASIEKFLYNDVAGLAPAAPGWQRIRVKPALTHRMTSASARVRTVRGDAAVGWRAGDGVLRMDLEVPATSVAEVWLPLSPDAEAPVLMAGEDSVWAPDGLADIALSRGIRSARRAAGHVVIEVAHGLHTLTLTSEGARR